ncbi:hypothetical protein C8R43DRAFT_1114486 [Mycena crocata]|nr:hypothetical protein C8R43DRAFT_1114486 [Mycena crocata]
MPLRNTAPTKRYQHTFFAFELVLLLGELTDIVDMDGVPCTAVNSSTSSTIQRLTNSDIASWPEPSNPRLNTGIDKDFNSSMLASSKLSPSNWLVPAAKNVCIK